MLYRGRRRTCEEDPEPQQRDLEILRALHRYRYLTTRQIAETWWPGCHLTRAQVRLRRMHDAGWIDRIRPRLDRGSHEWIYLLARHGFKLGQSYVRGPESYIPADSKWRPRDAVDLDYVWHDLEVNEWMLAYTRLLGAHVADWLGPAEARIEIESAYDPTRRRHARLTADRVNPDMAHANELRLGGELWPVFPDAAIVLEHGETELPFELLVEYDRTGRPKKNVEKLRRYDTLLTIGWRAVERLRTRSPAGAWTPPAIVAFVCQPGNVESFMQVADAEVTGQLGSYLSQERVRPGRDGIVFCDAADVEAESLRAWRLPQEPPASRTAEEFVPREARLPMSTGRAAEPDPTAFEWAF